MLSDGDQRWQMLQYVTLKENIHVDLYLSFKPYLSFKLLCPGEHWACSVDSYLFVSVVMIFDKAIFCRSAANLCTRCFFWPCSYLLLLGISLQTLFHDASVIFPQCVSYPFSPHALYYCRYRFFWYLIPKMF